MPANGVVACRSVEYSKDDVAQAKRAALSARQHFPAQCAAIRKVIPWEMIEVRLDKRGSSKS
jgi:hypothetical protein